jgi:hypothetical protein
MGRELMQGSKTMPLLIARSATLGLATGGVMLRPRSVERFSGNRPSASEVYDLEEFYVLQEPDPVLRRQSDGTLSHHKASLPTLLLQHPSLWDV